MSYIYSEYKKNSMINVQSICDMLSKNYAIYLHKFRDDDLNEINRKIFEWWYLQNYERIWKTEDENKIERLRVIKQKRDNQKEDDDCFTLFYDLIFIEMNIEKHNYDDMLESSQMFVNYCDRVGVILKREFKTYKKELKKYYKNYKKTQKQNKKALKNKAGKAHESSAENKEG